MPQPLPSNIVAFDVGQCSLGFVLVARSVAGVCAILLGDKADALIADLRHRFPRADVVQDGDAEMMSKVIRFLDSPETDLDLPLDLRGTAFQHRVWDALRAVPSGSTTSYTELAAGIGLPRAARAVAQACGANKIAVAVPCHRVVRRDGDVSGYRWGVARKQALLARESVARRA